MGHAGYSVELGLMSFKAFLFGTAAALVATSALAADLPSRRAPVPYAVVPSFTWTGFYAGLNVGAAIDNSGVSDIRYGSRFFPGSFRDTTTSAYRSTRDEVGFTGGAQAGYNHQFGAFVAGLEADINYADVNSSRSGASTFAGGSEAISTRTSTDYFGTVRGRLGFLPTERLMVYGTGGFAYGNVDNRTAATFTGPGAGVYAGTSSETQTGYALGGGVEYALTNNLTLKGEYLYVDLGRSSTTATYIGSGATAVTDTFSTRNNTEFSVARAGLNWKFNGF
jgi:outer membrane immunogenic protein